MTATGYYLLDHPNPHKKQYRETRRTTHLGGRITGAIVAHDAENVTDRSGPDSGAENVASWLTRRDSFGSYHRITDRDSTVPLVPYAMEAWHDTSSNNFAIGIAVAWRKADLPAMGQAGRERYYARFAAAILDAAAWCKTEHGILVPLDRFAPRSHIMAGRPGLTTHSRMDPRRRSDPFGTGTVYEAEFLAFLAARADLPAAQRPPADQRADPEVRVYQHRQNIYGDAGLVEDGIDGPYTRAWRAWTKTYQRALVHWRDIPDWLEDDGDYGPLTNRYTKVMQANNGLVPDGFAQDITTGYMRAHGSHITDRPDTRP